MKKVLALLLFCNFASAVITEGMATFQTTNTANANKDVLYPTTPAKTQNAVVPMANRNSLTTNQLNDPKFRLRSWLGAALWGTGVTEADFWTPTEDGFSATRDWEQLLLPQYPVFTENVIFSMQPPQSGIAQDNEGVLLQGIYPALQPSTPYAANLSSAWTDTNPLTLIAGFQGIGDLQIMGSAAAPPLNGQTMMPQFRPDAFLIDRMGDIDVDLIYQDPASPYSYTAFNVAAGTGRYMKFTMCQASPFVYVESSNINYIALRNRIGVNPTPFFKGVTAPKAVPGVTGVSYVLIYGNVDYPMNSPTVFGATLNPQHKQDNFTTWAIFWRTTDATFIPDDPANIRDLGSNNHSLDVTTPANKFWFVIAQVPVQRHYPTTGNGTVASDQYDLTEATNYAEAMGQYAFNFLTNSAVSYSVTKQSLVDTTYTFSTTNPYNDATMTNGTSTILTLRPHHYQKVGLGTVPGTNTGVGWDVLDLNGSSSFEPTGANKPKFWSPRGDLKAILGTTFITKYLVSNFLHSMPPPDYDTTFTSATNPGEFTNQDFGEFLFWVMDKEFNTNLSSANNSTVTNPVYGNITYALVNRGTYGTAFDLHYQARQFGPLQNIFQTKGKFLTQPPVNYQEDLANAQRWIGQVAPPNDTVWNSSRPGIDVSETLKHDVQQVQLMIQNLFQNPPIKAPDPTPTPPTPIIPEGLENFAFYDTDTGNVICFPVANGLSSEAFPAVANLPFYNMISSPDNRATLNEGFGSGSNWNDHHFHYGYWISAAALAAIYDSAWDPGNPMQSTWANGTNYGPAIDALVMDLAFDPAVDGIAGGYFRNAAMTFAKMNFFDQWAGHGWADGLQAYNAGGNIGHNENSQEGSQPFAAIAMWGIGSNRQPIADLGFYLYATCTFAFDFYMFDKNLNYKPGGSSSFVPVTTETSTATFGGGVTTTYPAGSSYWDYTIHATGSNTEASSASPLLTQASINFGNDFGGYPLAFEYIQVFPFTPWTLSMSRNINYMQNWLKPFNEQRFLATVNTNDPTTSTWNNSFVPNMLLLQSAVEAKDRAIGSTTPIDPYQFLLNQVTVSNTHGPNFFAPFTGTWSGDNTVNPSVNINPKFDVGLIPLSEMLNSLGATETYGSLDWTVRSESTDWQNGNYAFSAAFAMPDGSTTFVAFNPNTTPINVEFFRSWDDTFVIHTLNNVPPKQWAIATNVMPPLPPTPPPSPPFGPPNPPSCTCSKEDIMYDLRRLKEIYDQEVNQGNNL